MVVGQRHTSRVAVVLVLAGLTLPSSLIQAQNIREDSRVADSINLLDRWIDAQREYDQFPGISMALVHDQTVLWSAAFGYADLEAQRLATPKTM